jgi:signal transduction histidine kinase
MFYRFSQKISALLEPSLRNYGYFEKRFYWFSLIAIFGFPLYYFIWSYFYPQSYENLPLRLLGSSLFLPIILRKKWPLFLEKIFPYYWYFCLLYALPFFFTFMTLKTDGSPVWVESSLIALFVMMFLLDWFMLLIQSLLGIFLALVVFFVVTDDPISKLNTFYYIPIFAFAILIGIVANYESEKIRIEQENAMLATAGSVAHELRTPLAAIRSGTTGIKAILPHLLETYKIAKENGLVIPEIRKAHLNILQKTLDDIELETRSANSIIEMLLISTRFSDAQKKQVFEDCSALHCVKTALEEYPLAPSEKDMISIKCEQDFQFSGSHFLVTHIILNLLKNSLREISSKGNGSITITIKNQTEKNSFNTICFLDTAGGIPSNILPYIFKRFYTTYQVKEVSSLGMGIGLAFCKDAMHKLGGTIECDTIFGSHTKFILSFPK